GPGLRGGRRDGEGQREAEVAAAAYLGRNGDLSAQQRHQPPRDREAESGAAVAAGHGRIRLRELLEDRGQLLLRDADPRIAHAKLPRGLVAVAAHRARGHVDLTALGELDRVPDQVDEDLSHARRISAHEVRDVGRHVHRELEVFLAGPDGEQGGGSVYDFGEIERDGFELEMLRLDLRVVEYVVEDGEQRF